MSGFITFAIVIALIVVGEMRKNKQRDEKYRQDHPYQSSPQNGGNMKQTASKPLQNAIPPEMRRQAEATKQRIREKTMPSYQNPDRTRTTENRQKTTPAYQASDDNTVYQQMMQTRADDAAKKKAKDDVAATAENQEQLRSDAYRAEADSISTEIDSSKLMDEVYDILACGYHPQMSKQRDFVGEAVEMLASMD